MKYKWILDAGTVDEGKVYEKIKELLPKDIYFLAGCTDAYCAGEGEIESFLNEKVNTLLEMRVFSDDRELFFSRSMIGQLFDWRVTTDEGIDYTDYIDYVHFIDINSERSYSTDKGMHIISTVGGEYDLPLKNGENMVLIRAYISYDKNGVGKVVDHRIRGFRKEQEVNNAENH